MARRAGAEPPDDDPSRPPPPGRPRRVPPPPPPKLHTPKPPRTSRAKPAKLAVQPPPRRLVRPLAGASRIQVTLGPDELAWLDTFAASHRPPITTRAEALRRALAIARAALRGRS